VQLHARPPLVGGPTEKSSEGGAARLRIVKAARGLKS